MHRLPHLQADECWDDGGHQQPHEAWHDLGACQRLPAPCLVAAALHLVDLLKGLLKQQGPASKVTPCNMMKYG